MPCKTNLFITFTFNQAAQPIQITLQRKILAKHQENLKWYPNGEVSKTLILAN